MNCERALELISAELDGAVTQQERAELQAHLDTCPDCRETYAQLHELDALLQDALEQYQKHSIFVQKKTDADALVQTGRDVTVDSAVKEILGHIRYILHDAQISKVRKLLTIEQFRNPALAQIQTKMNYTDILAYFTALMRAGIRQGRLLDRDAEMMAAQLCLPVSVWINLCDREPDREAETMAMIERHIRQFYKLYRNPA